MSVKNLLKLAFFVWLALWAVFFIRENKKGEYEQFFDLAKKDLEGKRAYLMGDELFEFAEFCQDNVPAGSKYKLTGLEDLSVEKVRLVYYLYPMRPSDEDYDYVLVYGRPEYEEEGFEKLSELNKSAFILKKK